jgi:hypothetical protein
MDSCLSRSVLLAQRAYGQFNRHADSEQRVFRLSGASVYLFTCSLFGVAMGIGALMIAHCVFFSVLLAFSSQRLSMGCGLVLLGGLVMP